MSAVEHLQDPFVPEIEQSLLGALLMGEGLPRVRSFVREEHFQEGVHQEIYRAICDAHDRFGSSDVRIVAKLLPDSLGEEFRLKTGLPIAQYLGRLIRNAVHMGSRITDAGKHVVEQWARLKLAEELDAAAAAARDPSASIATLLRSTGSTLEEIQSSIRGANDRRSRMTIGQAGDQAIAQAREAMASGGGLTGISWGYADVNRLTGGMQRKDLILMGARPSMGKSSVMISTALSSARAGHGIGILSLEMDSAKLTARAQSDLTYSTYLPVPYADILWGKLDEAGIRNVEEVNARLHELPIEIDEAPVNTFDIRMKIETMMERFERAGWPRLECLMLDHLGFVQPGAHYKGNRNNEVGEITRALKDFAKEYNIAVLLLSQLSRQATQRDNKRPILSDLRDSGNIEQDADVVVFLHREAYYLERLEESDTEKERERLENLVACQNKLEFIIAKQRNGPVTTVDLWCDMAFSAVRNAERYGR